MNKHYHYSLTCNRGLLQREVLSNNMFYPRSPFVKCPEISQLIRPRCEVEQMENLLAWMCRTPKTTTIRVNQLKIKAEELCLKVEKSLMLPEMPNIRVHPYISDILNIYSFEGRNTTPLEELKEIVVDVNCAASILRGAHLYAPGVLSMTSNTSIDERVNVYADVDGSCKKGTNVTYLSPTKVFIGIGIVKQQRYQLFGANLTPSGIAVQMTDTLSGVPSIGDTYFQSGYAMLQNLPSIICGHVLNPKPGEIVLDMCAAPGNKTTHLAELMSDTGLLVALDKTPNKLKLLLDKMATYDLKSVKCYMFDSTKALRADDTENINQLDVSPPFRPNTFDKILLDAPCSALGNRPMLRNDITPKMLKSYAVVQRKLFAAAVSLLRSGGVLVYSTCTVTVAENEDMVRWVLEKYSDIQLVPAEPLFGGPGWSGAGLTDNQRILVQRFGPEMDGLRIPLSEEYRDSVGFFIAKFIKK